MSPLIKPPQSAVHPCVPPLVERVYTLPMGVCADKVNPTTHTTHRPPAVGSTWDCPDCGAVWVVSVYLPSRGYIAGDGREWVRAGWLTTRRHRRKATTLRLGCLA